MKPAWDQLIEEYANSQTTLVADVDCTAGGESLCQEVGVQGYPTIKYGNPADLKDYDGGRDIDALKEFAAANLGPSCGPAHLDLCSDEKKTEIEKFSKMSVEELDAQIAEKSKAIEERETEFKTFVDGLQKQYSDASRKKDNDIAEIKNQGLGLMKAVAAHHKSQKAEAKGEL